MSIVTFQVHSILGVEAFVSRGPKDVQIECEMTTEQMKETLESFIAEVGDAVWESWVRELARDILSDEYMQGHGDGQESACD